MASETTKDPILDLLYGDLDAEEREELRAQIEGDPEEADELESFELLLGQVRDADLNEEVPETVTAAILDAARAGASRSDVGPRAARRSAADSQSLWSRFVGGGSGQIVLVATVLLAGAFVFRFVDMRSPATGDSAEAPLTEMTPAREEAAPAPELAEQSEAEAGFARGVAEESADAPVPVVGGEEMTEGALEDALAAGPEEEFLVADRDEAQAAAEQPATSSRTATTKRRSRRVAAKSKKAAPAKSAESLELFGDSANRANSGSKSSASGVTSKPSVDMFEGEATEKKTSDKGTLDYIAPGDPAKDDKAAAPAAPAEPQKETGGTYRPPEGSPAAIQQKYDSRDYKGTIQEANSFLGGESSNATDRATVMQLKASSLYALGRYSEADRVYASIQRAYPNFRPDQVGQARAEIARRLEQRKRPKRKAKPSPKQKQQYDFEDDAVEEAEPSSLF